ncbi:hypothetical protein ACS0TY_027825 [Phlomoides rotata]
MRELPSSSPKFTWLNKQMGSRILEKLDRFVANADWCERFPNAKVSNGDFYGSDHRAIKVQLSKHCSKARETVSKRFMFENKWLLEDGYNEMVSTVWAKGEAAYSLPDRLTSCGRLIQAWAHENFG